ncbi:MAG TPA: phosphodiester glycosidase family protein, partial [Allosphingosinicella sp.]|nr:phosphodiester glycosidase family protein [Allosphingosinicella sp.]
LGPRASRLRFAMNAGMYDEAGAPIGLFVRDGRQEKSLNRREGSGNFHLMPNGVFAVDGEGKLSVTPSAAFAKKLPSPKWATQSGPMLVIDGKLHPKFDENGESQLIRNGVGVADPGTAYFVISEDPVSFGRFARFFRDELDCKNALYLDGSVSSLWDPAGQRQDAYSELGPMIAVFRR